MSRPRHLRVPILTAALATALAAQATLPAAAVQTPHDRVVSADPVNSTPHVLDGRVNAFVQVGGTMFVGGSFTQVREANRATILPRSNLFAFNASTGVIDTSFTPNPDGEVTALASDGTTLYVGGRFSTISGATSRRLARLQASGSPVAGFRAPAMNGVVKDLKLARGRLYIGGTWTTIAGVSRPSLAALDPVSGALDSSLALTFSGPRENGPLQVLKFDIYGTKLVAIGNFSAVAGQARHQIAVLDLASTPATLANWSTTRYQRTCAAVFPTYMRDVDIDPTGAYFSVVTTGGANGGLPGGSLCDTATRWALTATGSGQQPAWVNYTGGDTLTAVAITGPAVYVGGHQRWMDNPYGSDSAGAGAVPREGIAALDPNTGRALSWNPGRSRGVGVFDIYSTAAGLWVGSDTERLGGEYHARLGMFPR